MLKRILASMAITSLLLTVVLSVYWVRADHGKNDELSLGGTGPHQTHFYTVKNVVMVQTQEAANGMIASQTKAVPFKTLVGYTLYLPGIWLAIYVRSKLPRPKWLAASNPERSRTRRSRGI